MEKWKWLSRAAGLLIVIGFLCLLFCLLQCGFCGAESIFSFAYIAANFDTPILYLVPILAIAAIILSLLQKDTGPNALSFLWGQLAAILLLLLTLVVTLLSLISKVGQGSYGVIKVTPTFGTFFILGAVVLFLVAWMNQKNLLGAGTPARAAPAGYSVEMPVDVLPPPIIPQYTPQEQAPGQQSRQPYLTALSGNLPFKNVQVGFDNFTIGRSSTNHLHLEDLTVSRTHAVFRNSQGSWFLQDQESSGGTYVNGSRTDAIRLSDGDEIGIGPYRFRFHLPQ